MHQAGEKNHKVMKMVDNFYNFENVYIFFYNFVCFINDSAINNTISQ